MSSPNGGGQIGKDLRLLVVLARARVYSMGGGAADVISYRKSNGGAWRALLSTAGRAAFEAVAASFPSAEHLKKLRERTADPNRPPVRSVPRLPPRPRLPLWFPQPREPAR